MSEKDPRGPRVLVVDDEPEVVELIRMILQELGYTVRGASDGSEALLLFHQENWAIVITDRIMPRMSGDELRRAIRELDNVTPVVLVSGHPKGTDESQWDAVIPKPFSFAAFTEGIRKATQRRHSNTIEDAAASA